MKFNIRQRVLVMGVTAFLLLMVCSQLSFAQDRSIHPILPEPNPLRKSTPIIPLKKVEKLETVPPPVMKRQANSAGKTEHPQNSETASDGTAKTPPPPNNKPTPPTPNVVAKPTPENQNAGEKKTAVLPPVQPSTQSTQALDQVDKSQADKSAETKPGARISQPLENTEKSASPNSAPIRKQPSEPANETTANSPSKDPLPLEKKTAKAPLAPPGSEQTLQEKNSANKPSLLPNPNKNEPANVAAKKATTEAPGSWPVATSVPEPEAQDKTGSPNKPAVPPQKQTSAEKPTNIKESPLETANSAAPSPTSGEKKEASVSEASEKSASKSENSESADTADALPGMIVTLGPDPSPKKKTAKVSQENIKNVAEVPTVADNSKKQEAQPNKILRPKDGAKRVENNSSQKGDNNKTNALESQSPTTANHNAPKPPLKNEVAKAAPNSTAPASTQQTQRIDSKTPLAPTENSKTDAKDKKSADQLQQPKPEQDTASKADDDQPQQAESIQLPVPNPLRKAKAFPRESNGVITTGALPPSESARSSVLRPINKTAASASADDQELAIVVLESLTPLLTLQVSDSDKDNAVKAIRAIYKNNYKSAETLRRAIKNPLASKLIRWYHYRSDDADLNPTEIELFRRKNPDWPSQELLRKRAESILFEKQFPAKTVVDFFKSAKPETAEGKAALALALLASGDKNRARKLAASAWHENQFSNESEEDFIKRLGDLLTVEDHRHRLDRLLYKDDRHAVGAALKAASYLPPDEQAKAQFRAAVVGRKNSKAEKLFAALPKDAMKDPGVYLNRIQWLRRNQKHKEAWRLLRNLPFEPHELFDLNEWWIERRVNCRAALNAGFSKIAYDIARNHGPISGDFYAEAEFLSGWIALRFLKDPEKATDHFLALRTSVRTPKLLSRADYWLGRATQDSKNRSDSDQYFAKAAKYTQTFYGQLAASSLKSATGPVRFPSPPKPTFGEIDQFQKNEAVKTMVLAHKLGLDKLVPVFTGHLTYRFTSPSQLLLLTELSRKLGYVSLSVRIAKSAVSRNFPFERYAFPIDVFPEFKKLNGNVDQAFIHALSRQESEFNPRARSPAGALGLMQIMPATAKIIARQHNVKHHPHKLLGDPSYNAMLGVAHIRDLLNDYNGSYILTMVAYNAGPGRVNEWIELFGDPRSREVDPIDWIEQIPFTETRKYVQKILETVQVFRVRFDGTEATLQLFEDLNRGRQASASTSTVASGSNKDQ